MDPYRDGLPRRPRLWRQASRVRRRSSLPEQTTTNANSTSYSNVPPVVPASSVAVLCFAGSIAGYMISWCTLASDYTIYLDQSASTAKIFGFAYAGFFVPNVICEMVGASFAISMYAPGNENWLNGYTVNNVGGLLDEVMRPAGGFGKFCIVLLALSCIAASSECFAFDLTDVF